MDIKVPESKVNLTSSQLESLPGKKPKYYLGEARSLPFSRFRLKRKDKGLKKYPPLEDKEEKIDLEEVCLDEFERILAGE